MVVKVQLISWWDGEVGGTYSKIKVEETKEFPTDGWVTLETVEETSVFENYDTGQKYGFGEEKHTVNYFFRGECTRSLYFHILDSSFFSIMTVVTSLTVFYYLN